MTADNLAATPLNNNTKRKGFLGQPSSFWLIFIAILTFTLGFIAGQRNLAEQLKKPPNIRFANPDKPAEVTVDFAPFWQVWKVISEKYLERASIDPQKLLYGAISGMVKSLDDPYTSFLTPEDNKAVKEELGGSYEGVGIQLGFRDKKLVVIAPLTGTPAEKAGVLSGDEILKIDQTETEGLSLPEAVKLIRGLQGSKVTLTILRNDQEEPIAIEIVRAKIQIKSVEAKFETTERGEIAIIKIVRFGEQTNDEWNMAVNQTVNRQSKAVILDVRNNPGGFLSGAVHIASEFVSGKIVGQENAAGERQFFKAEKDGKLLKIPMVVLINKGSASAAEIVAGAISEKNRARLVGEKTFGKGTIQDASDLPDGSGVHVTVAKWLLPSGRNVNEKGIEPDVQVKISKEDLESDKDPQLDKAIEIITGQI